MWTVVLFNMGGELDRVTIGSDLNPDRDRLSPYAFAKAVEGWSLSDGDTIRVIGPEDL